MFRSKSDPTVESHKLIYADFSHGAVRSSMGPLIDGRQITGAGLSVFLSILDTCAAVFLAQHEWGHLVHYNGDFPIRYHQGRPGVADNDAETYPIMIYYPVGMMPDHEPSVKLPDNYTAFNMAADIFTWAALSGHMYSIYAKESPATDFKVETEILGLDFYTEGEYLEVRPCILPRDVPLASLPQPKMTATMAGNNTYFVQMDKEGRHE